MPRPRKIDRPVRIDTQIPASIHGKMMRELYSEVESRVPHGAISSLMEVLITRWLQERSVSI